MATAHDRDPFSDIVQEHNEALLRQKRRAAKAAQRRVSNYRRWDSTCRELLEALGNCLLTIEGDENSRRRFMGLKISSAVSVISAPDRAAWNLFLNNRKKRIVRDFVGRIVPTPRVEVKLLYCDDGHPRAFKVRYEGGNVEANATADSLKDALRNLVMEGLLNCDIVDP